MISSNCSNSLQANTANNPYETTTSELTSNEASVNNHNRIVNFNGFNIIEFPPEIHMEICKYLDSLSMKALRRTCTLFRDNVSMVDVRYKESLENELREAIGAGDQTSCERIHSLRKKGATLPLGELTKFLRGALRMESSVGVRIAKTMWQMGATLPTEDLPETLKEVLRLNCATAVRLNAKLLRNMGATLPYEELAEELRGALRTDSRVALSRVIAIMSMGVTLPRVELPELMQSALAMQSPAGILHALTINEMMRVQPRELQLQIVTGI